LAIWAVWRVDSHIDAAGLHIGWDGPNMFASVVHMIVNEPN